MKIIKLIFFLFIYLLINFVKSDQSPITLIVNPNINNSYVVGEKCGIDETNTCNSISDAVAYFKSIAVLVENGNIYQQLNVKLKGGKYGVKENSVNLFQFNCTISPLISSIDSVIFDGSINPLSATETMFSISASNKNNSNNNDNASTVVVFEEMKFINFNHSVIQILSNGQNTDITIEQCEFNNFQVQPNVNIIKFSKLSTNTNSTGASILKISNSVFSNVIEKYNIYSYDSLILVDGINNIKLNSVHFFNNEINEIRSMIFVRNSNLDLSQCHFEKVNTSGGAIYSIESNVTIDSSTFVSMSGSPSVLYFTVNQGASSFKISNCTATDCYSGSDGGVIYSSNSYGTDNSPMSYIIGSTFNSDKDKYYSVLYSYSPVTIEDCIFNSSVKNVSGKLFSVIKTSLTVINSKMISPYKNLYDLSRYQRSTVSFLSSDILFDGCTFGDNPFGISCSNSNAIFNNSKNLNPYYDCWDCIKLNVGSDSICYYSSTTSNLLNNSLKLMPNSHLIFTFILLIITIISYSLFVITI
ncbi:hypothetical protein ACTFIZ_000676 [Dictyostelium cf. discoideum]